MSDAKYNPLEQMAVRYKIAEAEANAWKQAECQKDLRYFMAHCPEVPEWFKLQGLGMEEKEIYMQWPLYFAREMVKRSNESA